MRIESYALPSAQVEGTSMFMDDHRDTHLIILFEPLVRDRYAPFVRDYCDILLHRMHPIFDEIRESNAPLSKKILGFWRYKEGRQLFVGNEEEEAAYSGYWGVGVDDWDVLDMQTVFLAIGITGLFYLFEKQLYQFVNGQLRCWLLSKLERWTDLTKLLGKFDRKAGVAVQCTELIDAFKDPDLVELVLVANAVKHGGGTSYDKLVEIGSEVVSKERILTNGVISVINVPLSVQVGDVKRYQDAVIRFWMLKGAFYAPSAAFSGVRTSPDWSILTRVGP